jgi:hypothetical protein
MTAKQALVELAADSPDDIEWEEAVELLYFHKKIQDSLEAEKRGEFVSMEEAEARFSECLKRSAG